MKFTKIFLGLAVFLAFSTLTSCLDNDDDSAYYNNSGVIGIVTVKPLSSSSCYMQLDDSTTLFPLNDISSAFSLYRERRAIVHFNVNKSGNAQGYSYAIYVNSIDSILTKTLAPNMGNNNDEAYGKDGVNMKSIWIEDGYITFQFTALFGGTQKHLLNLVQPDANKPYELEFHHNSFNDPKTAEGWGLVSFKLDALPNTGNNTVKLTIKYRNLNGSTETYEIAYKTNKSSGTTPSNIEGNLRAIE